MTISPLTYPGSKRRMLGAIRQAIPERVGVWLEPFAGGASAALRLLSDGIIERAVLADRDELVAAFWVAATVQSEALIEAVRAEEISLARRDLWCSAEPETTLDKALACLVRNRLSYGGSLVATVGVTGGRDQAAEPGYLEARFQRAAVIKRLEAIGSYANAGRLEAAPGPLDWRDTLRVPGLANAHLYLDPVYVGTDARTYVHGMSMSDHRDLAKHLMDEEERPWLLSYGDVPAVRSLYANQPGIHLSRPRVSYAAVGTGETGRDGSELLISNYARRKPNRNTSPSATTLRLKDSLLATLDDGVPRAEQIRQLVEQIAEEGLPFEDASDRGRTQVPVRVEKGILATARAEAERRGMSLAEAVERLIERS